MWATLCREKIIKREGEGGRELPQMHGEIMIKDQRAKVAVILTVGGKGKEWLYTFRHMVKTMIKTKKTRMWYFHFGCLLPLLRLMTCIQQTFKNDQTSWLSPRCSVITVIMDLYLTPYKN